MDERRLHDKLDKIEYTLSNQAVTLGRLTVSVEEHVKRSNMHEDELKSLQRHQSRVEGAGKLLTILALLAAILEAIHIVLK